MLINKKSNYKINEKNIYNSIRISLEEKFNVMYLGFVWYWVVL